MYGRAMSCYWEGSLAQNQANAGTKVSLIGAHVPGKDAIWACDKVVDVIKIPHLIGKIQGSKTHSSKKFCERNTA